VPLRLRARREAVGNPGPSPGRGRARGADRRSRPGHEDPARGRAGGRGRGSPAGDRSVQPHARHPRRRPDRRRGSAARLAGAAGRPGRRRATESRPAPGVGAGSSRDRKASPAPSGAAARCPADRAGRHVAGHDAGRPLPRVRAGRPRPPRLRHRIGSRASRAHRAGASVGRCGRSRRAHARSPPHRAAYRREPRRGRGPLLTHPGRPGPDRLPARCPRRGHAAARPRLDGEARARGRRCRGADRRRDADGPPPAHRVRRADPVCGVRGRAPRDRLRSEPWRGLLGPPDGHPPRRRLGRGPPGRPRAATCARTPGASSSRACTWRTARPSRPASGSTRCSGSWRWRAGSAGPCSRRGGQPADPGWHDGRRRVGRSGSIGPGFRSALTAAGGDDHRHRSEDHR
jgi:hypothetical protein